MFVSMNLEEQIAEAMIRAVTAPAEAGDDAVKHAREEDGTIWHFARVQARAALEVIRTDAEPLGEPVDPRFCPTRRDLVALREDALAMKGAGVPATVIVAPRVLYLAWPNGQYDPTKADSTRWRCVSFNLPE